MRIRRALLDRLYRGLLRLWSLVECSGKLCSRSTIICLQGALDPFTVLYLMCHDGKWVAGEIHLACSGIYIK